MKAVIQRVNFAKLRINQEVFSKIKTGLVVLVGITHNDDIDDVKWLVRKILNLRIFDDNKSVMNKSIIDIEGEILVVSQFTLHAQTKKGNRPSYINAAKGEKAKDIYNNFLLEFKNQHGVTPKTGKFGADMIVELENNGPVTILIDTKNKL